MTQFFAYAWARLRLALPSTGARQKAIRDLGSLVFESLTASEKRRKKVLQHIDSALTNNCEELRLAALDTGLVTDTRRVAAMIDDRSPAVAMRAVAILTMVGTSRHSFGRGYGETNPFLDTLSALDAIKKASKERTQRPPNVREALCSALERVAHAIVENAVKNQKKGLDDFCHNGSVLVSRTVAALRDVEHKAAFRPLIHVVTDEGFSTDDRIYAVSALSKIGDGDAIDIICDYITGGCYSCRKGGRSYCRCPKWDDKRSGAQHLMHLLDVVDGSSHSKSVERAYSVLKDVVWGYKLHLEQEKAEQEASDERQREWHRRNPHSPTTRGVGGTHPKR